MPIATPLGFASGFGDEPGIVESRETAVHMEDASPAALGTAGSANIVAAPTRSAWQTDCIALRCMLDCAWATRAPGLVQYLTGATWG